MSTCFFLNLNDFVYSLFGMIYKTFFVTIYHEERKWEGVLVLLIILLW